jgi:arsenite-transporting ATPase
VAPIPLPDAAVFGDIDRLLYRKLRALRARVSAASSSVRLVVTPERMVIDEAVRAFTDLALFEIPCDAVVMNRLLPAEAASEAYFRDWARLQEERRREVESLFAPLPVLAAPLQDDEVTGLERLRAHGEQLFAEVEPDAVLSPGRMVKFVRESARGGARGRGAAARSGYRVELPLPGATRDALDVAKRDDALFVRAGATRRVLKLPRGIASLSLRSAKLEGDTLLVHFAPEP